ncbi:MAG TPA: ribonuclease H-like domain-containing protein [Candidatus Limnocylindria bacterium]|nr:ribonuclease H-like domain-containing protein [Candidatus Limnocylindria bacterium]
MTLEQRLAAVRAERGSRPLPVARNDDVAARLAAWGGARLTSIHGGRVALVERRIPLPPVVAARLAAGPPTAYFDTETTGLSTGAGTVVILVAVGHLDGDAVTVRQALLPDYPDEPALLRTVMGWVEGFDRMVTYNGRGFDVPLMAARMTIHGMGRDLAGLPAHHDDLLPVARRLWRRILGSARLADIERGVLDVRRRGDCPSSEVPQRWFAYLAGASPDLLAAVVDHNAQDVASLALLDAELVRLRGGGWRDGSLVDHRGLALEMLRDGSDDEALELLEGVLAGGFGSSPLPGEEPLRLRRLASRLLIANGQAPRAETMWRDAARSGTVEAALAWIEVARLRERHAADLRGALEATRAASRVLDLALALGRGGSIEHIGRARLLVDRRRRRLTSWVAAAERRATRAGSIAEVA